MRAYIYRPEEIGLTGWPDGLLRLDGVIPVTDPQEAEVFICPGPLLLFNEARDMDRFPYMNGNEQRHVFFDVSENCTVFQKPCIFIRCNLKTWMKAQDPNSISFPWPVENYAECVDVPEGGFTYDVSFHGWLSCATRFDATDACRSQPNLTCDLALYSNFTGAIYYDQEGIRRRAEFRRSMRQSRVCLCPESIPGDFPYRFFEAMSAGRVPVLVGRNQVFPFADEIPYDEFSLKIDVDDVRFTGYLIKAFLDKTTDVELKSKGALAREYWLKYLNRDNWPKIMMYAVRKKFKEFGYLNEEPVICV